MAGSVDSTQYARTGGNPFLVAVNAVSTVCGVVAALLILASIFIICQMLFIRYVLNGSTIWQTEAVTMMVIASVMLGLPYVQRLRGHVNVDLIPLATRGAFRKMLAFLVLIVSLVVAAGAAWYSFNNMFLSAWDWGETTNTPWDPPKWPVYLSVAVGFGLLALQLLADLIGLLTGTESAFSLDEQAEIEARAAANAELEAGRLEDERLATERAAQREVR